MALFDDVLLTVDFDRTLTAPDTTIPARNLEAIHYFVENGGVFTLNTGRSTNTMGQRLTTIPVNAPFLLYNGSAAYDVQTQQLCQVKEIDLDVWRTMEEVHHAFPELNLEIQGVKTHYLYHAEEKYVQFYDAQGFSYEWATPGTDMGPFIKFTIFGNTYRPDGGMAQFFTGTEEELRRIDEAEAWLNQRYGHKAVVFRAGPRILDIHSKGVSKLNSARELQRKLGRRILVCVGDAENDLTMMQGADYAFCPADGVIANAFPNVCNCAEGAVADVIYKEIPAILQNKT